MQSPVLFERLLYFFVWPQLQLFVHPFKLDKSYPNARNCFNTTSLIKNVYIPFTYENGVNTATYNSFITAGYDEIGTTNGVYLMDIENCVSDNWEYKTNVSSRTATLTKYIGTNTYVDAPSYVKGF